MKSRILTLWILLSLLLSLTGCGPQSTPTPPPTATEVAQSPTQEPTATPAPSNTPSPTDTPPPTDTPQPTATPEPTATFEEANCPFELPAGQEEGDTIECGYLVVPEDRSDPNSPDIRLAVAIFHHPDGAPEPDPIIYLEGGPGGSALEFLYLTAEEYEPVFGANRDVILFDQRGVGLSEPALDCPEVVDLSREVMDYELDGQELTEEDIYDLMRDSLLACGQDLSEMANLSAYNTAANAADVEDLRQALGYEQVNLWGVSYGTRLALEVMRDHPEGVRSVVLDSVFPPDADLYAEAPANADRAFDALFDSCAADEACNTAYPDLRAVVFDTVDRLNETPAQVQITDALSGEEYDALLTGDDILALLFQFLYQTDLLPLLPQIFTDASNGDYTMITLIAGSLLAQQEVMSQGMQYSVQCNEEIPFSSEEELEATLAEYPELRGLFEDSTLGELSFEVCAGWDAGQADPMENEPVTSDIPTLVMAGEFDPITPPAGSRHVAQTLSNSYFFEYPATGHGASIGEGCPMDMMVAFLDDPFTEPDDACIAEMGPLAFAVPGAGAEAIELEPFTNKDFGITGVAPVGWEEVGPGVRTRGNSALDVALVATQAGPVSADTLLGLVTGQLGLDETPEPVGEREANGLTWTLYAIKVQGIPLDIALTESGDLAMIVMLQSSVAEHDALYEAVFLPIIDTLVPLE